MIIRDLAVVGVVFIALATPLDEAARVSLRAIPLLATASALDEILLGILCEDGLVLPLVAHRIKLRPRTRVGLEDLFTTDHISHNWKKYSTKHRECQALFSLFFRVVSRWGART